MGTDVIQTDGAGNTLGSGKPAPARGPRPRHPQPKADVAEATVAVAHAPVVRRAGPVLVQAKHPGTYPRPGETYPRYRKRGDVFPLNHPDDFTPEWMVEVVDGNVPALEPEMQPGLPQTTGPRRVLPTHPPMQ